MTSANFIVATDEHLMLFNFYNHVIGKENLIIYNLSVPLSPDLSNYPRGSNTMVIFSI